MVVEIFGLNAHVNNNKRVGDCAGVFPGVRRSRMMCVCVNFRNPSPSSNGKGLFSGRRREVIVAYHAGYGRKRRDLSFLPPPATLHSNATGRGRDGWEGAVLPGRCVPVRFVRQDQNEFEKKKFSETYTGMCSYLGIYKENKAEGRNHVRDRVDEN